MKITCSLLALSALSQASAFVVPTPGATSTALFADRAVDYAEGRVAQGNPGIGAMAQADAGSRSMQAAASRRSGSRARSIFDSLTPVTVQGGSLRTWSFPTSAVDRVQVLLKTEGRPLNANVDLWQGPDNTPQKMGVYIEDGAMRPFCAVVETPRAQNTIAIRNTGQMEFPLAACVEAAPRDGSADLAKNLAEASAPETIQGGAIKTYSFAPAVQSVQILLQTDGRPLNARIELLQGPNNNKQVIELYTEDGMERPFFCVLETPGVGNVVRVLNTAPVEFPMAARVEPYVVDPDGGEGAILGDGSGWGGRRY